MPKYTNRLKHKSHYENVPQGWCGCLLGEICQIQSSKRVHKNDYVEKGVPFYRTTEIKELSEGKTISNCLFISDTQYSLIKEKYGVPHKGDILISAVGTIGITYVIPNEDHFYFKDGNLIWIGKSNSVNSDYLCMMLGHMVRNSNAISTSGSAYNALTIEKLTELEILLPPLTEQNRIIEELNKWYSAIEIIENGEVSLLDTIQNVKSKILNLAIHGKLVPQDPNDEPAIELLKRINPKFVPCDNAHYENVPKGWCTIYVGDLAEYTNGKAFKPSDWERNGLPIIRIQNLNDENCQYNYTSITHEEKYRISHGDLLFAWAASLGVYIWQGNKAWLNQHIFKVDPHPFIDKQYLYYIFEYLVSEFYTRSHGSGMVHITKKEFETTIALLPPLSEQRRIVKSIKSYYATLDNISAEL